MKKILTVTGVVALTLLIAFGTTQMIFAKGGMGNRNGGSGNRSGINNQPVSFVDKLKLNDDQIAKINALIKNDNTSSKTLQDKIRTNMSLLRELQWSKKYDQTQAEKLTNEADEARNTLRSNRIKLNTDIRSILTAEQISLFNEICGNRGNCNNGGGCGSGCFNGRNGGRRGN